MAIAGNVTVIPPKRTIGTQKKTEKVQKTRVAAYCRVSTEFEEQESRYEMQVEHYTSYIKSNSEWELVEVYADDGIGATNTAKRESFNRMIQDCRDRGELIDATYGRKTRAVLIMDSGQIILSAVQPETISHRLTNKDTVINEGSDD